MKWARGGVLVKSEQGSCGEGRSISIIIRWVSQLRSAATGKDHGRHSIIRNVSDISPASGMPETYEARGQKHHPVNASPDPCQRTAQAEFPITMIPTLMTAR